MKITQFNGWYCSDKYTIEIEIGIDDDIEPLDIAECFRLQYPNEKYVVKSIKFTKDKPNHYSMAIIIGGIKLK
jgi:hypothetical protein